MMDRWESLGPEVIYCDFFKIGYKSIILDSCRAANELLIRN